MFAVLFIADFALQAVLRTEPAAAAQPAALFLGSGKKSVVHAANPLARAAGVELGMTAPQAVARCPHLLVRTPSLPAETEARAALLAIGFTLAPKIEDTAPGLCTIDLTGADPVHVVSATHAALAALEAQALPATAGLAATPLLALYAARAAHDRALDRNRNPDRPLPLSGASEPITSASKITSKITSTTAIITPTAAPPLSLSSFSLSFSPSAEPHPSPVSSAATACAPANTSAQTQIEKEKDKDKEERERFPERLPAILHVTDAASFLAPLPLAVAEPPAELADVLHTWGLRTLGDLTALPRDEIIRRFGAAGLALWQRATGGEPRPLRPVTLPQTFAAEMTFEQEIETLEPLLFILRRFLDRLTLELRTSQHVAAEQHLTLRLEDDTQHARSFRLPEPTADPEILFRALHTHLEALQTAASIIAVALRLTPARPLVRQQDIFETGLRDPHGFAETLARVSALVGPDRVGTPQLEDTHRPDAVKLTSPAAVIPPAAPAPLHAPLGAPLRRFRPPLPARLEFTDQRPTYLWTEPIRGEISAQSPAYPSNGDWWQPDRLWQRTEWDIALADGGLYRLLLIGDSYFLEGEYD